MNISTPVDEKINGDLVIDDGEIIKKSLIVAEKLDVYLNDLKVVIKNKRYIAEIRHIASQEPA